MATGPKIVHKQFNSPIGLYSQSNIQETLNKHLKNLDNGTVGIDFSNPNTVKPANLANSAVLRMLEEEERSRMGYSSRRKVVWPPVPETNGYHQPQQNPAYYNDAQHSPSNQQQQFNAPSQKYQAPTQHHQAPSQKYQAPSHQYQASPHQYAPQYQDQVQSQSVICEGLRQEATGLSKLIPVGPGVTASPVAPFHRTPRSPATSHRQQSNRWNPVSSPLSPQTYGSQPSYQSQQPPYSPQQSPYSPQQSPYSPHQQYSEPVYQTPQKHFEPPPSTITLRSQQPIHQKPAPVFTSQPAAVSLQGGVNMRGDTKWPPQNVREAVQAENQARRHLARGPACRPRQVKKDYSSFFAQHAINNNCPAYRAPPGTQHYEDHTGRSSY